MARKIIGYLFILTSICLVLIIFLKIKRTTFIPTYQKVEAINPVKAKTSVVLITLDTTRADFLSAYNRNVDATPVIARLARKGIVFTNAFSVAPITLVAHSSIMTGLYPASHGVRNNGTHYLKEDVVTLAERFKNMGYKTAAFVSAAVLDDIYGLSQGFDLYDDDLSSSIERRFMVVPDRKAEYTVKEARKWLSSVGNSPFFLWVHFYDPHAVYSPPPPYRDKYKDNLYLGEIAYMDYWIGELLKDPKVKDSLIVIVGDHGESLGEHQELTHGILLYQSTLWIPFILVIPGGPSGSVEIPVSQVDIYPTLLSLLGEDYGDVDGYDISQILKSDLDTKNERILFAETFLPYFTYGWKKLYAARKGQIKVITSLDRTEVFDLSKDSQERDPLKSGEGVDEILNSIRKLSASKEVSSEKPLGPEEIEKLRALGYIVGVSKDATFTPTVDPRDGINFDFLIQQSRDLIRNKKYKEAVDKLSQLLKMDPHNIVGVLELARTYLRMGEEDKAREILVVSLDKVPYPNQVMLMLAILDARNNPQQALTLIEQLLKRDSNDLQALITKSNILMMMGKLEQAQKIAEELFKKYPKQPEIMGLYVKVVLLPANNLAYAVEILEEAVKIDPYLPSLWHQLAMIYERMEKDDVALEAYKKGLKYTPDSDILHCRLGIMLAKLGNFIDAEAHLLESLEFSPTPQINCIFTLGTLYGETGRFDKALEYYNKALDLNPNRLDILNNKAIALFYLGDKEQAKALWKKILKETPDLVDAKINWTLILLEEGKFDVALDTINNVLAKRPDLNKAWLALGNVYLAKKELPKALKSFERACSIKREPICLSLLANVYISLGQLEKAIEILEEAIVDYSKIPDLWLYLGDAYRLSNQKDKAIMYYKAFIRRFPSHPMQDRVKEILQSLLTG